jgi:hypothetical protein
MLCATVKLRGSFGMKMIKEVLLISLAYIIIFIGVVTLFVSLELSNMIAKVSIFMVGPVLATFGVNIIYKKCRWG